MKVPAAVVTLLQLRHCTAFAPEATGPSGGTLTCLRAGSQQHPAWEGRAFGASETSPWSSGSGIRGPDRRPPLKGPAGGPDSVGGGGRGGKNGFDVFNGDAIVDGVRHPPRGRGPGPGPPPPQSAMAGRGGPGGPGPGPGGFRDPAFYPGPPDGRGRRGVFDDGPGPPPPMMPPPPGGFDPDEGPGPRGRGGGGPPRGYDDGGPPMPPPGVFDPSENPGDNGSRGPRGRGGGPPQPYHPSDGDGGPMWGSPPRGIDPLAASNLGGTSGGRMPFSYKEESPIRDVRPYVDPNVGGGGGTSRSRRDDGPMPPRRGERESGGSNNLGGTSASQGHPFYPPDRRADNDPMMSRPPPPSVGANPLEPNRGGGGGGTSPSGQGQGQHRRTLYTPERRDNDPMSRPSVGANNPMESNNLGGTSSSQGRTFYAPERRQDNDPMSSRPSVSVGVGANPMGGPNRGVGTSPSSGRGRTLYEPERRGDVPAAEPNLGGTSSSQGRTFYPPGTSRRDDDLPLSGTTTRRGGANAVVPPERRDDGGDRVSRPRAGPGPGGPGPVRGDGFDMFRPPGEGGFDDGGPDVVHSAVVSVVESNLGEIAETLLFDLWEGDERRVHPALAKIADACGDEENRRKVFEAGGHTVVLKTMRKWYKSQSIQAEGCRAIQNLCLENGVPENVAADLGAFDVVCTAMKNFPHNERVQECGCGALLNLSRYETGADRFMRHKDGWYCLTSAMNEFPANRDLQYWVVSTIRDISRYERHRRQLVREGYLNIILDEITVAYGEDKQMYDAARKAMANLLTLDVQE